MLESLEGKPGYPRLKPPYPAQRGLFGRPTLVHNIETLSCIPHIVERGPEWFASIGTAESKGPKIFCVSGHVNRPGNYELPLGAPLDEIIYEHAGGIRDGRRLKAVIPGGASTAVLTADQVSVPMAFETLAAAGSQLGTGAIIVMDETTCMVEVARRLTRFFVHESCGRCVPCRLGSQRLYEVLDRIEHGKGRPGDVELALDIAAMTDGTTFCPMGGALSSPARSTIARFRGEYEEHVRSRECSHA